VSQTLGDSQSATDAQVVRQLPDPPHLYGVHVFRFPSTACDVRSSKHFAPGTQVPSGLHWKPIVQSVSTAHFALHLVVPSHVRLFAHGPTERHSPTPVHASELLFVQPQGVPAGGNVRQRAGFFPSHWFGPQGVPSPHAPRSPRGFPLTTLHVPFVVGSAHASQDPVHALSQQTPSTQISLAH